MTDLSEGTKLCSNCLQKINLANFIIHESFCVRNIQLCDICRKPVNKNQKDEHFQEFHAKVKCDCGDMVERHDLETHKQETCRKRQARCFFCELSLDYDKIQEHIDFCGSRTEKCDKCNQYIQAKFKNRHDDTNCAYPTPLNQIQPPAQQRYQASSSVPTYLTNNFLQQRARSFEREPIKRVVAEDQQSLSLLPCEFCSEFYTGEELIDHQNSCPLNPIMMEDHRTPDPINSHLNGLMDRNLNMNQHFNLFNNLRNPTDFNRHLVQNEAFHFSRPDIPTTNDNVTFMDYTTDDEDVNEEIVSPIKIDKNDNDSEKIPCELCDELIDFDDYGVHQVTCRFSDEVLAASRQNLEPVITQYDEKNTESLVRQASQQIENNDSNRFASLYSNKLETDRDELQATSSRGILKSSKTTPLARESASSSVSSLKPVIKASASSAAQLVTIKKPEQFTHSTRQAGSIPFSTNQASTSAATTAPTSSSKSNDSKLIKGLNHKPKE